MKITRRTAAKIIIIYIGLVAQLAVGNESSMKWPPVRGLSKLECGELIGPGHHGPFDYRSPPPQAIIANVEMNHFNGHLASMLKGNDYYYGSGGGSVAGGFDYTLRVFPNHHRALKALIDLSQRKKNVQRLNGLNWSVECYFERAIRYIPDDVVVRQIYAMFLNNQGRTSDAEYQIELIIEDAEINPQLAYNIGLFYAKWRKWDMARKFANIAYRGGFNLPGLREILTQNRQWDPNYKFETSVPADTKNITVIEEDKLR